MQDTQATSETTETVKERICQKCESKMVQRKSKFGTFYGCASYPKCTYKENH